MSINHSIVFGIGTLPEAKIGLVKGMPKRGMDSCGLHALASTIQISSSVLRKARRPGRLSGGRWPRFGAGGRSARVGCGPLGAACEGRASDPPEEPCDHAGLL